MPVGDVSRAREGVKVSSHRVIPNCISVCRRIPHGVGIASSKESRSIPGRGCLLKAKAWVAPLEISHVIRLDKESKVGYGALPVKLKGGIPQGPVIGMLRRPDHRTRRADHSIGILGEEL